MERVIFNSNELKHTKSIVHYSTTVCKEGVGCCVRRVDWNDCSIVCEETKFGKRVNTNMSTVSGRGQKRSRQAKERQEIPQ